MSFHIVMVKLSNNQCLFACEFMLLFIISLNVEIVTRIRIRHKLSTSTVLLELMFMKSMCVNMKMNVKLHSRIVLE